jgi:esterase/lipase superfamily enzyme
MEHHKAKRIGGKQAIVSVTIGIGIAQVMITGLIWKGTFADAFFWFAHPKLAPVVLPAVSGFYLCGYFFGRRAGSEILVKKQHPVWVGIKTGLLTLWSGTLLATLFGYSSRCHRWLLVWKAGQEAGTIGRD